MPDLTTTDTRVLKEYARVLRDAAILEAARAATWPAATDVALEQVEAELARRFEGRWIP